MTTRRLVLSILLGAGVLLTVVLVLALAVVRALPDGDDAAANAQVAADRVAPGQVRVLGAQWLGEAGGYSIRAVLSADPSVAIGWHGDRRCRPGSGCESHLLTSLTNGRDTVPELDAFRRTLDRCGLAVTGEPAVSHEMTYYAGGPTTVAASATVVVPLTSLDGPAAARMTAALDACVTAWTGDRSNLTPVTRARATLTLQDPDGRVHSTAEVTVTAGRVSTPASSTVGPDLGQIEKNALAEALDSPVRTFLAGDGFTPSDRIAVDEVRYVLGGTSRLGVTVRATRTDPADSTRLQMIGVSLESNRDGTEPRALRLAP